MVTRSLTSADAHLRDDIVIPSLPPKRAKGARKL